MIDDPHNVYQDVDREAQHAYFEDDAGRDEDRPTLLEVELDELAALEGPGASCEWQR